MEIILDVLSFLNFIFLANNIWMWGLGVFIVYALWRSYKESNL